MQATPTTKKPRNKNPALDNAHFLDLPGYNPVGLIERICSQFALKNDAALARFLGVGSPVISKLRHRRVPVGTAMLLRMHDLTTIPVNELRTAMGVPTVPSHDDTLRSAQY